MWSLLEVTCSLYLILRLYIDLRTTLLKQFTSQRQPRVLVKLFFSALLPWYKRASNGHRWTTLSGLNDVGVRVTVHKSTDPGQPNGVVLSAATSIWLPVPSQIVFNFFRDERARPQSDVLSNGNSVQEVAHIANGSHHGNCISVLRAFNVSHNMLILQESYLIQDMPNGYSKVTWMEHVEVEEKTPPHRLYRDLVNNGMAFGAEHWLATLQRMCERFACLLVTGASTRALYHIIVTV